MRKPTVRNKYNLKFSDIAKLTIADRSKITPPAFWRNDVVQAWCVSENTIKEPLDSRYGTYNDYWIGIYDENAKAYKGKIRVTCSAYGGMCAYKFKNFFDPREMEHEMDLEIQEKLLAKVNDLIDSNILKIS